MEQDDMKKSGFIKAVVAAAGFVYPAMGRCEEGDNHYYRLWSGFFTLYKKQGWKWNLYKNFLIPFPGYASYHFRHGDSGKVNKLHVRQVADLPDNQMSFFHKKIHLHEFKFFNYEAMLPVKKIKRKEKPWKLKRKRHVLHNRHLYKN